MGQTMGKFHQFQLADKINTAFGNKEFVSEDLNKIGVKSTGGQLNGMVAIGLLSRKRLHKQAKNAYRLREDKYQQLREKWK